MRLGIAASLAGAALACAAQPEPPGALARIRQDMARNLSQLPNFTCQQTIERFRRDSYVARFQISDRLRLEVAQIGPKELFSWPGAGRFEDKEIREIVGSGMTRTGDFALMARTIFLTGIPVITYRGPESIGGRQALRYDYRVSSQQSRYEIRVGEKMAQVPFEGSFWADAESFDLIRLTVRATGIPAELDLADVTGQVDYARVPLAGGLFLLPQKAEAAMFGISGAGHVNRTTFSGCRQFSAESSVSFDAMPESHSAAPAAHLAFEFPAGVRIETALDAPIDSRDAAIGDPISARISREVKDNGKVILRKDAVLSGRIRGLQWAYSPAPYIAIGLEFLELQFGGSQTRFLAELQEVGPLDGLAAASAPIARLPGSGRGTRYGGRWYPPDAITVRSTAPAPGIAWLYLWGEAARLPKGLRMLWKTSVP